MSLHWGMLGFFMSKKQRTIALSTTKTVYISCKLFSQLLWIKHQLKDYNLFESKIPILYDNNAAIDLTKNTIMHSHAKHIEIKHHFIRDHI